MPTGDEAFNDEGHLPDDAVVIRGGTMRRKDMVASVRRYVALTHGVYGLTVWSWPAMTAGDIAMRVKETHPQGRNPVAHGQLRQTTAGKIREPGTSGETFQLVKTGAEGHYTLTFPAEPTDADWERLEAMFGPAEPNPAAD
jgi:hypothetical protein